MEGYEWWFGGEGDERKWVDELVVGFVDVERSVDVDVNLGHQAGVNLRPYQIRSKTLTADGRKNVGETGCWSLSLDTGWVGF